MKKILIFPIILILISYVLVFIFLREEEIIFNYEKSITVRVKREDTGVIDKVYLEDYITGVLAGELPIDFNDEAFKAQAVAARSYVLKKMEYNVNNSYDVVDTIYNQVYLDSDYLKKVWGSKYVSKINKIKRAVIDTEGEYLTYDGKVIDAFFFSTSVGYTENSEDVFDKSLPYLRSVKSEWDNVSPVYKEEKNMSIYDFYLKLGLDYSSTLSSIVTLATSTGRVKKIKINDVLFSGGDVVSKLNLRSNYFFFKQVNDNVIITTKGYGHGVGMSQYGAEGMARNGFKYDEILKYYYKDVVLEKL